MSNYSSKLDHEVVPAWHSFIGEALPLGMVSGAAQSAASVAAGSIPVGTYYADTSDARMLRRIASGKVGYPSPETVWEAACASRTIVLPTWDGRWCAGPLALFAASRFELFGHVLLWPNSKFVSLERKRVLLEHAQDACAATKTGDADAIMRDLVAAGADDLYVQKRIRKLRNASAAQIVRPDRNIWILTEREEEGFELAWHRRSAERAVSIALAACAVAELHPEIGLTAQRAMVLASMREGLR